MNTAATGLVNASQQTFQNITKAANTIVNQVADSASGAVETVTDIANSLIPFGNGNVKPPNTSANKPANAPANNKPANNKPANAPANNWNLNLFKPSNNKPANAAANNKPANAPANNKPANAPANNKPASSAFNSAWVKNGSIFLGITGLFVVLFFFYSKEIKMGYHSIVNSIKRFFGMRTNEYRNQVDATIKPPAPGTVTMSPEAPQTVTPSQQAAAAAGAADPNATIVDKLLPPPGSASAASKKAASNGAEVFNVNENDYTFYDAEPLCKALGAELATYEQVKDAWSKGADWCNYGWVKGQMAIYPTQKETYDMLQAGPADQHMACGTPGINGGHFDNPEMKYGVNCYGKKPSQSAHDKERLMDQGMVPRSPETLKIQEKVNEFRSEVDSIYVVPFNSNSWSQI